MRNPRFSVLVWGIYEIVVGVALILVPAQLADAVGLEEPQDIWVRVLGLIVIIVGVYYLGAVFNNATWMYRYTVFGRLIATVGLVYLAIVDDVWQLYLFAVVEALSAFWTFSALRPRPEPVPDPTEAPSD